MAHAAPMAEIFRGSILESVHAGHAVVCDETGQIVEAWGNPDAIVLPRSSCKMLQALPLMESGAGADLSTEQLALACASHSGETVHVNKVKAWLHDLGLDEHALCCGPQSSRDRTLRHQMIRQGQEVTRAYNNCSGKHAGFLTLTKHLGAAPRYVAVDHPVQVAVKAAFEEVTEVASPGFGIDGCSAPNFATTVHGMARAMAFFASADDKSGARAVAAVKLRDAMRLHPHLVAGTGCACTELVEAGDKRFTIKTGAEGFFIAILPEKRLGIALKIADGATRAAEVAIAALLVRIGALDASHPTTARYLDRPISNWDGLVTGAERPAPGLLA